MPTAIVEEVCSITAKGQTTVPKAVRQALGVGYGGRIAFRVARGRVTVHALLKDDETVDPALTPFLALLEANMAARPAEAVQPLPKALAGRLEALAAEMGEVDLDGPMKAR
jgi:antitoxin PrlF